MATAAAGYTPLILSCEWNCPPACGVRCGSDGGCRATARPSSLPPETRHPASGHSSYSLPNRAVNEPLRSFHSAWRRPLLDTFLIRGFNMVSRHEIGTAFIKEKTLVGGAFSVLYDNLRRFVYISTLHPPPPLPHFKLTILYNLKFENPLH